MYNEYSLKILKRADMWFVDLTFNMWQGYVTSIVVQNKDFKNEQNTSPIIPGFVYLHQTKEQVEHVSMLLKLAAAIKLSLFAASKIAVVTDGEAPLIKAWQHVFPHMRHLLCTNHFLKNIRNKMQHKMKEIIKSQIKKVMTQFNGDF